MRTRPSQVLLRPSADPSSSLMLDEPPTGDTEGSATPSALSRRGFLRTAATVTGGGLVAAGLAACAPAVGPTWSFGPAGVPAPTGSGAAGGPAASAAASATAGPAASAAPSMDHGSPAPSGGPAADHDAAALAAVKRFLDGEWKTVEGYGNQPLEPTLDGDTKVFQMTVDAIDHRIDAVNAPVKALGFNGTWPGPRLTVIEGDKIRAVFKNNLPESTGIHFHGQRLPNNMDGVPHITQDPIPPGGSFTYEFVARTTGSHMYHSHHNATDQVGRGLLGAFIVQPKDSAKRYDALYGATQDVVWISNDALGGFTINGRGFPATAPIVATLGDVVVIRFMNEGNMMHPWHLHGMPMHVVARDGYPLGAASFHCDTLGVNPGERWDVVIDCDAPGAWAFHCHILQHAEGPDGMFGMVTALVVQESSAATGAVAGDVVATAARAAGSTAYACQIPSIG
jgi:manganese oxidase